MSSIPSLGAGAVEYLSLPAAARLIARVGVVECLRGLVDVLEHDFRRWSDFHKSARLAQHMPQGVIELMPIADARHYAFKYVNGHPGNTRLGVPTVMAFGAIARMDTGAPVFVSELTLCTALRTAATSVLAARHLARPDSRVMALIGNGSQSEFQALGFVGLLGIRSLRLYDRDPAATRKLVANLRSAEVAAELIECASAAEAVRGADIVTTLTADKTRAAVLRGEWLEEGMHINAVGGDCPGKTELHADVLRQAQVFVEYAPQTRIEGDIQQLPPDFAVTELWEVLAGQHGGRASDAAVTVFDSVGFALEDFSALRFLRDAAAELGMGQPIELIPQLSDPKNLFGLLHTRSPLLRVVA